MLNRPKVQKHGRIKEKRLKDPKHLQAVRQLPCLICYQDRSDIDRAAHHLLKNVTRGMGLKASDDKVIPLCSSCHTDLHLNGDETAYLWDNHIDNVTEIARKLYENTGNHATMVNIIYNGREI